MILPTGTGVELELLASLRYLVERRCVMMSWQRILQYFPLKIQAEKGRISLPVDSTGVCKDQLCKHGGM